MEFSSLQYIYIIVASLAVITFVACFNRRSRLIVRKLVRWVFYSNPVASFLRNDALQKIVPAIVAVYYISLDLWKDDWPVFSNYIKTHERVFLGLVGASLLLTIVRFVSDRYEINSKNLISKFEKAFVQLTSKIVRIKLERFKDSAAKITPAGNTFAQITQCEDQINLILSELVDLISEQLGVTEADQCISILRKDPKTEKWFFPYITNKGWKHTKPNKLTTEASAAKKCIDTGEPMLHVDKKEAARLGEYFLSERDKRKADGSVFCYPVITKTKDYEDICVISIVTYGKMFCDPIDTVHAEAIKVLLCEICKRLDLELTLESIKIWKENNSSNTSRRAS